MTKEKNLFTTFTKENSKENAIRRKAIIAKNLGTEKYHLSNFHRPISKHIKYE